MVYHSESQYRMVESSMRAVCFTNKNWSIQNYLVSHGQSRLAYERESGYSRRNLYTRQRRELILKIVKERKIVIIIDETGEPKKGKATDYVARQYLGRLGKIDNGIVAVVSYGLVDGLTFPLMFEIYKPKERLKLNDSYLSKPQIASQMIREIKAMGFEIDCVLADSLYGESTSTFIRCLQGLNLQVAVAIRSNHGVRLPA